MGSLPERRSTLKTTVIIPNYNGKKYLDSCLDSLKPAEQGAYAVILVDNGSTDNSAQEALRRYPWIRLISFDENRGFSAAVNEGIRAADTPYVFLLNNDARMEEGCVAVMERRMEKERDLFSLSARMLDGKNPEVMDGAGDLYSALGWAWAIGKGRPAERYRKPGDIFSACAGAAMYRKEYLEQTGLFDELHFLYLEDVDLGYRARICGYRNAYEPDAVVYHEGSGTSGSRYNPLKIGHSSRNSIYLIYKNMPPLQLLLNLPLLAAGFLIKTLFFTLKGYGGHYLRGIGAGFALCRTKEAREHRLRFKSSRLGNYIRIQGELWLNIFRRI